MKGMIPLSAMALALSLSGTAIAQTPEQAQQMMSYLEKVKAAK